MKRLNPTYNIIIISDFSAPPNSAWNLPSLPKLLLPPDIKHSRDKELCVCREKEKKKKKKKTRMIPQQWTPPCGNECTHKYAALMQIPWRVFCKKGCDADGDTWEECLEECQEICYKDPVLKDKQWSAYIDRSPGAASYSEECFHACVSGCGYKFEIPRKEVDKVHPNRPCKPLASEKPPPPPPTAKATPPPPPPKSSSLIEDVPCTSA